MQPAHFLVFPNLLSLEQIAFLLILIGEKALDCTHIQRFPKPARTCNQRDFICIVPPLPDKIRLVNIEDVIVHHFLIILISQCVLYPHLTSLPSSTKQSIIFIRSNTASPETQNRICVCAPARSRAQSAPSRTFSLRSDDGLRRACRQAFARPHTDSAP